MWGLFVYQRYRGTAASRLLMEAAIDCCEHEQGIESVVTCFDGGNLHARQYFSRFGFELYDPGPVKSNADWRTAGLVHMCLPVSIGRASCRESVCQYVKISVVANTVKNTYLMRNTNE